MTEKQRSIDWEQLTVGQIAQRSGAAASTLQSDESKGLLASVRNASNHRRYPREVLRRVAVIRVAQSAGIPLADIREASRAYPTSGRQPRRTGSSCRRSGKRSWLPVSRHLTELRDHLAIASAAGASPSRLARYATPGTSSGSAVPGPGSCPTLEVRRLRAFAAGVPRPPSSMPGQR